MVSALVPRASPGQGHCVVFLGKILNSHSASLHPGNLTNCGEVTCDGLASRPLGRNTPSCFMLQKPG